ncbi:uncharacterized protein LOC122248571 isoform X2 [Penaeus japonicus]|uniref:Farnesoic acid O-methyltransferase n=1 Tax=Penaeus japonicus TaxID=27405 RepID=Q2MGV9_PENJP|nr:uncharacterized protein LOC122248571 isoform X2 [Penaeus japonicus]BAE78496.1 farnesoic acid O-methyltransferase [Penaeus japonicus]
MADNWPSYGTDENKEYRFRSIKGKTIRFQVKAAHDAHIALTSGEEETDPMLEVFIGGWEGAASAIRFKKADDLTKVDTPDILSEEEYREFWIAFDHDVVRVGKGGEWEPFMSATVPEPFDITHYGYSTGWGAVGWWQFHSEMHFQTEDCLTYNFIPVYGDTFSFSVACSNDAHLALTSGPEETSPMYEVFIGGWENQHSAIRLSKEGRGSGEDMIKVDTPDVVCCEEERKFYVTFKDGHIRVGYQDSDPFMEWTDPEPWKITHIGYCTGWGATGKWKFEF